MSRPHFENSSETVSRWETPRLSDNQVDKSDASEEQNAEALKQQAFEEAKTIGYQTGIAQAEQEIKDKLNTLNSFLTALTRPFNDQNNQISEELALLAGKIAKNLVRRELRTEPETIMVLVRDTVTALNTSNPNINIHLNPKNAKIIRDIINVDSQEQSWKIIDDPLVSHSDCKVSCEDSLIDADLETRINLIITQFLGDERSEKRS